MHDERNIINVFNELISGIVDNEVLESYLYEHDRIEENNSYEVRKLSKIYLTKKEIIKASYTYDSKKILAKIYLERSLIKDMNMKLKYTYRLGVHPTTELIGIEAINNFNLPSFAMERFEEDYRRFLIKFYELHLDD